MDYFKVNYNKLQYMPQLNFNKIIILLTISIVFLIVIALNLKIYHSFECYGVYSNNLLTIKINNELSDEIKNSKYITFNKVKTNFKINNYGKYEITNEKIYQEIELIIDEEFYDDEIGLVKFYYDKKNIFKFIFNI